jgi:hypothetical protein
MNRRVWIWFLLVSMDLLVIGGVSPPVNAAASRPFVADFAGQAVFTPTSTPGIFAGTGSGAGSATHLGGFTIAVNEMLDVTSPSGEVVLQGRAIVVAANGDELHWTYSGTGTPPSETGDVLITGTFTITGGSGRFTDATGQGSFEGVGNVVTGRASFSYTGTISY